MELMCSLQASSVAGNSWAVSILASLLGDDLEDHRMDRGYTMVDVPAALIQEGP